MGIYNSSERYLGLPRRRLRHCHLPFCAGAFSRERPRRRSRAGNRAAARGDAATRATLPPPFTGQQPYRNLRRSYGEGGGEAAVHEGALHRGRRCTEDVSTRVPVRFSKHGSMITLIPPLPVSAVCF